MRCIKKACSAVVSLLFAGMILLGIGMILLQAAGYRMFAVKTGSMGNLYPVGALLLVDDSGPEEIIEGDVISFVVDDRLTVVTHRVVFIDRENQCFYTKGDQNQTEDESPVVYENLLGKVICGIPWAGYLVLYAKGRIGRILLLLMIAGIVIVYLEQLIFFIVQRRKKCQSGQSKENEED